jgi:hypothetical protein
VLPDIEWICRTMGDHGQLLAEISSGLGLSSFPNP